MTELSINDNFWELYNFNKKYLLPKLQKLKINLNSKVVSDLYNIFSSTTTKDFYEYTNHNNSIEGLSKILKSNFLPTQIKKFIQTNLEKSYIQITSKNYKIIFYVLITKEFKEISKTKEFKENLLKAYDNVIRMYEFKKTIVKSFNKCLKIFYVPTKFKKFLNENNKIIGAENVNSGVTSSNHSEFQNKNICSTQIKEFILIFREEEFMKVLFHELMHFLSLDLSKIIYSKKGKIIDSLEQLLAKNIKNILPDYSSDFVLLNESCAELNAVLINTAYVAYNLCKNNKKDFGIYLNKILNYELSFSLFQTSKIFLTKQVKEKTNYVAYFLIKTLLMIKLGCLESLDYLIPGTETTYIKYFAYAISKFNKNKLKIFEPYIKIIKTLDKKSFLFQTCRMTNFG